MVFIFSAASQTIPSRNSLRTPRCAKHFSGKAAGGSSVAAVGHLFAGVTRLLCVDQQVRVVEQAKLGCWMAEAVVMDSDDAADGLNLLRLAVQLYQDLTGNDRPSASCPGDPEPP